MNRQHFVSPLDPHLLASRGWFLSAPNAVLCVQLTVAAAALFLLVQVVRWNLQATPRNPFSADERKKRRGKKKKTGKDDDIGGDIRQQQSFAVDKVPEALDVIVVGGGIAGLSTAAILAKAGRRVLVLEGSGHAGGGGEDRPLQDLGTRFLLDQVTNGQVELAQGEDSEEGSSDILAVGNGKDIRRFTVSGDHDGWRAHLEELFPTELEAITTFFGQLEVFTGNRSVPILKVLPLWLSWVLIKTRLVRLLVRQRNRQILKSTKDLVQEVTENKDLQVLLAYTWMIYGPTTSRCHLSMRSSTAQNCSRGAVVENIAASIGSVIERSGGIVLVNAMVEQILHNGKKVMGVSVRDEEGQRRRIEAPVVVSTVGVLNTFQRLLPAKVARGSYFFDLSFQHLQEQARSLTVLVGLSASCDDLQLPRQRTWAFGPQWDQQLEELMLISFPRATGGSDSWKSRPGLRKFKDVCVLSTSTTVQDNEDKKLEELSRRMVDRACEHFPALRDHVGHVEIGAEGLKTRCSRQSLSNDLRSLDPLVMAKLRPGTDVEGLFLAGQDVLNGGFAGNLHSGLLSAGVILGRDLFADLVNLYKLSSESDKKRA